jgi:hypothetical protein
MHVERCAMTGLLIKRENAETMKQQRISEGVGRVASSECLPDIGAGTAALIK